MHPGLNINSKMNDCQVLPTNIFNDIFQHFHILFYLSYKRLRAAVSRSRACTACTYCIYCVHILHILRTLTACTAFTDCMYCVHRLHGELREINLRDTANIYTIYDMRLCSYVCYASTSILLA